MRIIATLSLCLAGAFVLAGCEDDPPAAPPPAPSARATRPRPTVASGASGPAQNNTADAGLPPLVVTDNTFIESRQVRDPFHSNAELFVSVSGGGGEDTRAVLLPRYSLDDLQLVAVIVGTDSPYAMVRDPSRSGTVLRRGAMVGRGEMIHSNIEGRQDYFVHWRVSRINPARLRRGADGQLVEVPAEIIFERPDPLNPNAQVVERSLAMIEHGQTAPSPIPAGVGVPIPGSGPAPGYLPNFLPGQSPPPGTPAPSAPSATAAPGATTVTAPAQPPGTPQTATTTVIVQPPAQPQRPPTVIPPSNLPPPIRMTGDESPLR